MALARAHSQRLFQPGILSGSDSERHDESRQLCIALAYGISQRCHGCRRLTRSSSINRLCLKSCKIEARTEFTISKRVVCDIDAAC